MKVSIIHPSRQRPQQALATYKKWISSAKYPNDIEYIMSIDNSDPEFNLYYQLFFDNVFVAGDNNNAVEAINRAATYATGDLFIQIADDFDCPFHWDVALLEALKGKSDFIVKTDDGAQPWIITLPIMDRVYYNRFGYIYPPHFTHLFSDTWITHVADLLDRKITLPITFKHRHYTTGETPKDAINEKNDKTWGQGEAAYLDGVRTNFGLKDEDIKGCLNCDIGHIQWLRFKSVLIQTA